MATAAEYESDPTQPISPGSESLDPVSEDADSAYADIASETASLTSSIMKGKYENGRRYHAYQAGKYLFPDDEQEQDRLDIKYASLQKVFNDKIVFAPLNDPKQILDVGTGTGIWAIDAAEEFTGATITATDLSPIQPTWVPPNVKFEIDDAEQQWTWPRDFFDLVHIRTMTACIRDWDKLFMQAYRHTKPGGYIELQEMDYLGMIQSTSRNPGTFFLSWSTQQGAAGRKAGIELRTSVQFLTTGLTRAGFVDARVFEFKLPIGPWAKQKRLRDAGLLQLSAMLEGIEGLSLKLYTFYAGWSLEELKVLLAKVRTELKDPGCHAYWPVIVVYARKPGGAET
ncbi:S-adenosyl-L-methionine-dependent methyltransferase [Phaeosphaeriaceae sp. PMI808]|nr:S-adenosyl-L-methionine-dependent methyltransferase [Phaeosphaeriaceae sp. PMI808]